MARQLPVAVCLLLAFATAGAHPHAYVDQQALISVGTHSVDVTVRIVPSFTEGAAIFARIDSDSDGKVSDREAAELAAAVVATVQLEVDGMPVALHRATAVVPGVDEVSAGFGVIEISAAAAIVLAGSGNHQVSFNIGFDDFSADWQVQPYFYTDLVTAMSSRSIARNETGNGVNILLYSPGGSPSNTLY